jgi:hypothetical protein
VFRTKIKKHKVFTLFVLALLVTSILLMSMNVPASVALTPEMYWKANFIDYAPSGMPDFDQRQPGWNATGWWTWCAPAAVANSFWWIDSRYETSTTPPPTINGTFPLVSNYTAGIDDHDPANVVPFIKHLAYLMDTDGQRTSSPTFGTNVFDMQAGIAQYLSWTGVNPLGDVNGDGRVDMTDYDIVLAANGSSPDPAYPNWDMAADIWPETVAAYTADNIVDSNDLNLVTANMNKTGMFYERTVQAPDFYFIEEAVEKSEDVILVLGFYHDGFRDEDIYAYESGHVATVAGVNSTTMQIAISDPIQDNAELPPQGTSGPGRVLPPPPHPHGLGPIYPLHNNASYVSQDTYSVNLTLPPILFPANFSLINYSSQQFPGMLAVVEWAVIVSPLETMHKVFVIDKNFTVVTLSNSRVSSIAPNVATKTMSFNVTGPGGTMGFCNVTIPKELMSCGSLAQWLVTVDSIPPGSLTATENGTHTFLYFIYSHSTKKVEITSLNVYPEFPSAIILPFFITISLIALTLAKKKLPKK